MLGWLQPKCPVDLGTKLWVEDRMGWLLGQFGRERLAGCTVVVPTRQMFPDRYDNSERAARSLFERTCGFMGIDPARVDLVFYQPTHRPGLARSLVRAKLDWAGQYEAREGRSVVRVDVTLLPTPDTLVAIFAHELAHVHLLGEGRICAEDQDHEFVTDLTTVFFGLGVFNANASFLDWYRLNRRGETIARTGYLDPDAWCYALALFAWLRKETKPAWAGWLRLALRSQFRKSLAYLTRTGDAAVVEGGQCDDADRALLLGPRYIAQAAAADDTDEGTEPDNETDECDGSSEPDTGGCDEAEDADPSETGSEDANEVLLLDGWACLQAGEWQQAVEAFTAVLHENPADGEAYQQRAWANLELGRLKDGLLDAEAAVHFEPDDSESYLARGAAYVKVQQFGPAIEDLTRYLKEEDTFSTSGTRPSRALYLRGLAQAGQGDFAAALKDYCEAIQRWPDWPEPYEARAEVYDRFGEFKAACADREQAQRRATP